MNTKKSEANIPTLFAHNHASNIMPLSNGDLLCVWFAGSREGRPDISILSSRLKVGLAEWEPPVILSNDTERSEQNPVLFEEPDGNLWLIYTAQESIHQSSAVVRCRFSRDFGYTWCEVYTLFDTLGSFVRQPPIQLDNGELLLPAYYSLKSEKGFASNDFSVVKISADHGATWKEFEVKGSIGLVHMCVIQLSDGSLVGFFRSRKADYIYSSKSKDYGRTWDQPTATQLMNNNSSIQCISLNNGHLAMVFNNINAEIAPPLRNIPPWFDKSDIESEASLVDMGSTVWGVIRAPLTIAISEDGGNTWPYRRDLETQEDASIRPEFSYPSIKQTADGKIHITYTYSRQYIKYVSISEEWVTKENKYIEVR